MSSSALAYAFSAGMVGAINPCGFALLPAYLSYYLGLESAPAEAERDRHGSLGRSLRVSAAMTAGFVLVFGIIGAVWSSVSNLIGSRLPWVTVALGIALILLGIAMLRGFMPTVRLPKMNNRSGDTRVWSVFVFGISYGIASLSCTIGPFIAAVTTTFRRHDFVSGLATLVFYGLGMGAVITILTVAVGYARQGIVTGMRRLIPHMGRISGVLLIISGLVAAYYGWYEADVLSGGDGIGGPGEMFSNWQSSLSARLGEIGEVRIGVAVGVLVLVGLIVGAVTRYRRAHRHEGAT